jgi:indolepyruvate ferredoxin oxidoreductase beta subunit
MQSVIVGVGGQGIVFASKVLGHVALKRGDSVMGSEVHGMSQRGGSVISHFKIGQFRSPLVRKGCADVLLAFDQMEALRSYDFLVPGGHAVVNVHDEAAIENPDLRSYFGARKIRLHAVRGYEILKEHMGGKFLFLNVLILGAMCGAGAGNVTIDEVRAAVSDLTPQKFLEANLKGLDLGYEAVRGQ